MKMTRRKRKRRTTLTRRKRRRTIEVVTGMMIAYLDPSERQTGFYLTTKRRLAGMALSLIQRQPLEIVWKLMVLQQKMRLGSILATKQMPLLQILPELS